MKKTIVALFLVSILMLVGCSSSTPTSKGDSSGTTPQPVVTDAQIQGSYVFENVTINTYSQEPASLKDSNTVIINGLADGEFIEVIVEGEIKDFRHVELVWDDQKDVLTEKSVINKFDTVVDKTIVIETVMAETIPSEKIEWKTMSGKAYEYIIQYDGVGSDSSDAEDSANK